MGGSRRGRHVRRLREELHGAPGADHTPREVAGSFALGTFVTMLPTLGTGLLLFVALVYVVDRMGPIALFASVLVFNPAVKVGVYAGSFALGLLLLGPVEGVSTADVSLGAGPAIAVRLLVGNPILAAVASVGGYAVVHRLAVRYASTGVAETVDEALGDLADDVLEP